MTVWFENARGDMRQIASCDNLEKAYLAIYNFVDKANAAKGPGEAPFRVYYVRHWEDETTGMTKVDVGSWNEFFYIETEEGETVNE